MAAGRMRIWETLAGLNGLMAVAFGAFAAHGIKDASVQTLLHTGSQYQAVHAVAALTCGRLVGDVTGRTPLSAVLFSLGALVFGGSLYVLALTGVKLWGAVTPIGGLLLLAGWGAIIWAGLRGR